MNYSLHRDFGPLYDPTTRSYRTGVEEDIEEILDSLPWYKKIFRGISDRLEDIASRTTLKPVKESRQGLQSREQLIRSHMFSAQQWAIGHLHTHLLIQPSLEEVLPQKFIDSVAEIGAASRNNIQTSLVVQPACLSEAGLKKLGEQHILVFESIRQFLYVTLTQKS